MPFAFYDPECSLVRTSGVIFPWDSTESSPTLPAWGSMHGGELCELPTPVPLTDGSACSSSLNLPTPDVYGSAYGANTDRVKTRSAEDRSIRLVDRVAALLPTPTARDAVLLPTPRAAADRTGRSAAMRQDSMSGPSLAQAVELAQGILPREFTPSDKLPPSWRLLPTPTAIQSRNRTSGGSNPDSEHHDGVTSGDWAWEVTGLAPTPPPSIDGPPSSDDPPLTLWSDAS